MLPRESRKRIYRLSLREYSAVLPLVKTNNGKWVVATLIIIVVTLAFFSVQIKKDIMRRSAEAEAAESTADQ